jgi:hypothetical protein
MMDTPPLGEGHWGLSDILRYRTFSPSPAAPKTAPSALSRMIKGFARMQKCVEVKNIVFESGHRPHGLLHF